MYELEFRAALATSTVPPYHVEEVVAGWFREDLDTVWSGFVIRLRDGSFAYITSHRNSRRDFNSGSTQRFKAEPTHLYQRASIWEFDKEKLNGGTEVAKQEAKYPATNSISIEATTDNVVRTYSEQSRVVGDRLHG